MEKVIAKRTKTSENNLISSKTIDGVRNAITTLFNEKREIRITVKKSKVKREEYTARIVGVYQSFFTVEDARLKIAFSLQYIDLITGSIAISV